METAFLKKFEHAVIYALIGMMIVVILISPLELAYTDGKYCGMHCRKNQNIRSGDQAGRFCFSD
jgi:hypothetical protein